MERLSHEARAERRRQIAESAREGLFKEELMFEYEVGETTVKKSCREFGVTLQKHPAGIEEKCFRFLRLVQNGATPRAAARHLAIGPEMRERIVKAAILVGFIKKH
jgi:hypothetical protein